jgi:hypothetical protein
MTCSLCNAEITEEEIATTATRRDLTTNETITATCCSECLAEKGLQGLIDHLERAAQAPDEPDKARREQCNQNS